MKYRILAITLPFVLLMTLIAIFNSSDQSASQSRQSQANSPCNLPLSYRFGNIDQRFDITENELREVMEKVGSIWSNPLNAKVLKYNPNGNITINFVYSDMQKLTENERAFSNRIETKKVQRTAARKSFQRLKTKFQDQLALYNELLSKYKKAVNKYNTTVKMWEGREQLSNHEKAKLESLKREIERIKVQKNHNYQQVESLRNRVNKKARQLNALVDQENELVSDYNKKFSGAKKFDQGHYIKRGGKEKINVYQYNNFQELKVVLAHEFGHALGLSHGSEPGSIMFYLMNEKNQANPALSNEDITAIKKQCF